MFVLDWKRYPCTFALTGSVVLLLVFWLDWSEYPFSFGLTGPGSLVCLGVCASLLRVSCIFGLTGPYVLVFRVFLLDLSG